MIRIILSIILGFVIPVGWLVGFAIAAFTLHERLPESIVNPWIEMFLYGESVPGVLLLPVAIPEYIYALAKGKNLLPPLIVSSDYMEPVFFVAFNWMFYGAISYVILGKLKTFKKQIASGIDTPPAPPSFEPENNR